MGSLVTAHTIKGFGKGLEMEHTEKVEEQRLTQAQGERTSREIQLQRMRDNAAQERQRDSDKAAAQRDKDRYGPGGMAEQAATHAAGLAETTATKKAAHDIEIETMRQEAATARERMKINEKNPRFDFTQTKASTTFDAAGNMVTQKAGTTVTDKMTNVTYQQVGTMFIPQGWEPPTPQKETAGNKAAEAWLLNPKFAANEMDNSLKFLQTFGFLPVGYFSKFGGFSPTKKTITKGTDTAIAPANPLPAQ